MALVAVELGTVFGGSVEVAPLLGFARFWRLGVYREGIGVPLLRSCHFCTNMGAFLLQRGRRFDCITRVIITCEIHEMLSR